MDEHIKNRLVIEIEKAYYISKRYNAVTTFSFLYFEGELDSSSLGKFIQISDHILKIDANRYFINYTFSKQQEAFKASRNLLLHLDKHLSNSCTRIALDTFDITRPPLNVLDNLSNILEKIKNNDRVRIEDKL